MGVRGEFGSSTRGRSSAITWREHCWHIYYTGAARSGFNPPTVMHLRMAELAADELMRRGYDVWGVYLSPVADSYGKPGLAPAADRVAMCRLAAAATSAAATSARVSVGANADTNASAGADGGSSAGGSASGVGAGSMGPGASCDGGAETGGSPATTADGKLGLKTPGQDQQPQPQSQPPPQQQQPQQQPQQLQQQPQQQWLLQPPQQLLLPDPEPDLVMVYGWEAAQPGYTRTLAVLRRVETELRAWLAQAGAAEQQQEEEEVAGSARAEPGSGGQREAARQAQTYRLGAGGERQPPPPPGPQQPQRPQGLQGQQQQGPQGQQGQGQGQSQGQQQQQGQSQVRAMLLCGADVLASMASPGVWRDPDVILREHGVVCIARAGSPLDALLSTPGNVLYEHRHRVVLVTDRVGNSISSSAVRAELAAGRPVRHLLPAGVLSYIHARGLYGTGGGSGGRVAGAGAAPDAGGLGLEGERGEGRVGGGGGGQAQAPTPAPAGGVMEGVGRGGGGGMAERAGSLEVIV
ncbi:hypothetical protein HYH02_007130 [Chlamydomonas schloesseri]|uniref:Cytidyltransferase-like domain-containing protein n=1 Tax=Chlamydomonas schloesseri TaxID=2026947 RepID=A0A835WIN0_9CHLO|nr:hypothetical protein HYH02_007130 [Chlamydomonas schloesseri]|eukprot:KAG2448106.1 hypothetical protein HYH02_007130 [Chlamydomonas schloesseri]